MKVNELIRSIEIDGRTQEIIYRQSREQDKWKIERLIYNHFGDRSNEHILDNVDKGRYFCAFINDGHTLIGITGVSIDQSVYNGYEIEFTCLDEKYRGHGIITHMIGYLVKDVHPDIDIYCTCWAKGDNPIHLHHAMKENGFEYAYLKDNYFAHHTSFCHKYCVNFTPECYCREELYIRKGKHRE